MILVIRVWRDQGANLQYSVPDEKLEETRTNIADMIGAWSSASEWSQIDEWTWRKTDGERIEIMGIGGEKDYSLTDVKRAFWERFHEAGEVWISNLGTPEENARKTEQAWGEFQEYLPAMAPLPHTGVDDQEINASFHHLWTKAVHQERYVKAEWQELARLLGTRGIAL